MLGDRHQKKIEKESLVGVRFAPGHQKIEELSEAQPSHEIAAKIVPADLDSDGIGRAKRRRGQAWFADEHVVIPLRSGLHRQW